jgi:hypothetical protein
MVVCAMRRHLVHGIYVVEANKEAVTEFWAVATLQENAVAAVEKELGLGWSLILTDRRLTARRLSLLKMRPNTVRKLGSRNTYRLL